MKKIYSFSLCIFILLGCGYATYAQGWSWGRAASNSLFVDSWPTATDASGNVFGAGVASGSGTPIKFGTYAIPVSTGSYQSMWVKYDPTGAVLWADGTISGNTYIFNIATDPAGNLILFGSFSSPTMQIGSFTLTNTSGSFLAQYYVAKVSPGGTVLWAVNDGNAYSSWFYTFGTFMMSTGSVATDATGNIYITSSFNKNKMTIGSTTLTNADPSGTTYDVFVAKYSPAGALLWVTSIGGTKDDYAFGITVSSLGDVYISGDFLSPSITVGPSTITNPYANPLAYIARFSGTGTPLWAQCGGGKNGSFAVGLAHDNSGNVYMTGGFEDVTLTLGATTISRPYPPKSATQLALFLVQYTPSNTVTWNKCIASLNQGVWGYSIALASCGEIWVSGNYNEAAVIDAGDTLVPVTGSDPVFIAGYNLAGGVVGYAGLASGGDDQNGIACDAAGNVYICSDFYGPSMVVGPDTLTVGGGSEFFYLAKYKNSVIPPDTIYATKDTLISCTGTTSSTLTAPAGYSTYYWDNGSGGSTRTITSSGTYYVYCVSCGADVLVDTFNVSPIPADTTYGHSDTSLCAFITSVTLNGPPGCTTYSWSTGGSTPSITVSSPGTYIVMGVASCKAVIDTIFYTTIKADTSGTHTNKDLCATSDPLTLTATPGTGYTSWLWNTGSTTASINVSVATSGSSTYTAYSTKECTIFADTFNIAVDTVPVVFLGNDTTICTGDSIRITSHQPANAQYKWSTGSSAPYIRVPGTGTYSLQVSLNGCSASASINVFAITAPSVSVGPDTVLCIGQQAYLYANTTSTGSLEWNTGQGYPNIFVTESGTYWATLSNRCGSASDSVNVTFVVCDLWFPSAFTPNGDGKNDIARVIGFLEFYKDFSLSIFNRYGQRVFYTEDIYAGWDGIYNGTAQDLGTYFYLINYSLEGKKHMMKGDLELIR